MNLLARMGRAKRAPIRLLVVAAAMVFAVTSCSSSKNASAGAGASSSASILGSADQAKGSPVLVGFISDGRSASIDSSAEIPAAKAAVSYINNHLGGIGGHALQLDTCTDGETPSGTTDCVNQMIAAHVVAVLYDVTGQGPTISQDLEPTHIPLFAYASIDEPTLLSKTAFVLSNGLGALAGPPALLEQSGGKVGAVVLINVPEAVGPVQQLGGALYKNAGARMDTVAIAPGTADMTPQIQAELNKHPDQVSIIGNDTFCISAIRALKTLGYTKQIVVVPACIDAATKKALASQLTGIVEFNSASTDPAAHEVALYNNVMATYGPGTASESPNAQGAFAVVLGFARALTAINGAITPAAVMSTATAMQPQPMPLTQNLTFQCNQKQVSFAPAICSTGELETTLDSSGDPTNYKPIDLSAMFKL